MSPVFLAQLCARGETVQERWRTLLALEPAPSPLGNPEALQHHIPSALRQILAAAAQRHRAPRDLQAACAELPSCDCGNNPYRAFFRAAEQALTEQAVLVQAALPPSERKQSDLAVLIFAIRTVARTEIDTFCGACVHHGTAARCRFAASTAMVR